MKNLKFVNQQIDTHEVKLLDIPTVSMAYRMVKVDLSGL